MKRKRKKKNKTLSAQACDLTYPSEITDADLDSHAHAAFVAARQVVGQPRDISREAGIDGACNEENACVDNTRLLIWIGCNAHGEPDNHDAQEEYNERAPLAQSVRNVSEDDSKNRSGHINGHRHQLGGAGCIAQILDNGRQEQADTVQGTDDL